MSELNQKEWAVLYEYQSDPDIGWNIRILIKDLKDGCDWSFAYQAYLRRIIEEQDKYIEASLIFAESVQ